MEKYFIKDIRNGIFFNIEVWKKEWSELMLTNITVLINNKKFVFYNNRVELWIAKTILNDLSLNKKVDVVR
jgi:hypothetical protein